MSTACVSVGVTAAGSRLCSRLIVNLLSRSRSQEAFAFIATRRPCVKLNSKMRAALADWDRTFNKKTP